MDSASIPPPVTHPTRTPPGVSVSQRRFHGPHPVVGGGRRAARPLPTAVHPPPGPHPNPPAAKPQVVRTPGLAGVPEDRGRSRAGRTRPPTPLGARASTPPAPRPRTPPPSAVAAAQTAGGRVGRAANERAPGRVPLPVGKRSTTRTGDRTTRSPPGHPAHPQRPRRCAGPVDEAHGAARTARAPTDGGGCRRAMDPPRDAAVVPRRFPLNAIGGVPRRPVPLRRTPRQETTQPTRPTPRPGNDDPLSRPDRAAPGGPQRRIQRPTDRRGPPPAQAPSPLPPRDGGAARSAAPATPSAKGRKVWGGHPPNGPRDQPVRAARRA